MTKYAVQGENLATCVWQTRKKPQHFHYVKFVIQIWNEMNIFMKYGW